MKLVELFVLVAGSAAGALLVAVLLAVVWLVQMLVVEPCQRLRDERRQAAARAAAAAAQIDADADAAVQRLGQVYAEAAAQLRRDASRRTS